MPQLLLDRDVVIAYLKELRTRICEEFETLEPEKTFQRTLWNYEGGSGGGEMSVLRGDVFEKAAVNWSGVGGDHFPMQDGSGPFFATGVSLITHMMNPHAPTVHFNIRFIEAGERSWIGGGYDLTPMGFSYEEDTQHFHGVAKNSLDAIDPQLYPQLSQQAKEYFYLPHRKKERGVGGIFFDHMNSGNAERDWAFFQQVGNSFLESIMPIYRRRVSMPYSEEDRLIQEKLRGHYAEFNLAYDRGTRFGFQSGGNPEAILCSMPPVARW